MVNALESCNIYRVLYGTIVSLWNTSDNTQYHSKLQVNYKKAATLQSKTRFADKDPDSAVITCTKSGIGAETNSISFHTS